MIKRRRTDRRFQISMRDETKRKNLSNLQEFAKSISYLQTHQIETMDDLQERIDELNGVVSVSKREISEKREQLKKLENLEKMAEVIKTNQPLIDEYNHFFFQKNGINIISSTKRKSIITVNANGN